MQSRLHFHVLRFGASESLWIPVVNTYGDADTVDIGSSDGGLDGAGVGFECPAILSSAKVVDQLDG